VVSDGVVVVTAADRHAVVADLLVGIEGVVEIVPGGSTRASSVRAGLVAVPDEATVVLVHDGARPLASVDLFRRVASGVGEGVDAVVPGVVVSDSLRSVTGGTLDREEVIAVQTPQAFSALALRDAHRLGGEASDDASLVETAGGTVVVVEGEVSNVKITVPLDLAVAELSLGSARPDHGGGMVVSG
jgi:2-C-methyl-D-erythritol 4-phosphate cytidylyltransferase